MADMTWASISFNKKQFEKANPDFDITGEFLPNTLYVEEYSHLGETVQFEHTFTSSLDKDEFISEHLDGLNVEHLDCDFSAGGHGETPEVYEYYRNGSEVSPSNEDDITITLSGLKKEMGENKTIEQVVAELSYELSIPLDKVA